MNLSSSQNVLKSVMTPKKTLIPGSLPKDCITSDKPACVMGIDEAGRGPVLGTYDAIVKRSSEFNSMFYYRSDDIRCSVLEIG